MKKTKPTMRMNIMNADQIKKLIDKETMPNIEKILNMLNHMNKALVDLDPFLQSILTRIERVEEATKMFRKEK